MKSLNDSQGLFDKSANLLNSDTKFIRENTSGSKSKGNVIISRRPVSLDLRLKNDDKRNLEELIRIKGQMKQNDNFDKVTKQELQDVVRSRYNRSLSPQQTANKFDVTAKQEAQDSIRWSHNRSVSPQLLRRGDSKGKVVIDKEKSDEWKEHRRYLQEKKDQTINLPFISSSPLSPQLTVNRGPNTPSYTKENKPPTAAFQAFQTQRLLSESDHDSSPELRGSPSFGAETEGETDEDIFDNFLVSTFPYVENSEISRHQKMNQDAEKMAKKKRPLVNKTYQDYLQRLKLNRRAIEKKNKEAKDAQKGKKKTIKSKLKWAREQPKAETPPPPEVPRKSIDEFVKTGRIIQSFRYSYAIDDFYNGKSRRSFSSVSSADNVDNEIKNGWLIQSLGAQVLNLQMRALPSCNPFELRRRMQMLRARAEEETRLLRRTSINELSRRRSSRVRFQEPVSSLQSIYERSESIQSDVKSDREKNEKRLTPRLSVCETNSNKQLSEFSFSNKRMSTSHSEHETGQSGQTSLIVNTETLAAET